jgi:phage shock protein E
MGFFDFLKLPDIQQGVREYGETPGAVLLDVRTAEEYREGHIPGSRNLPLDELERVQKIVQQQDTPVFLYCYSGARSGQAAGILRRMGYTRVKNAGGIAAYRGKVERI